MIPVIHAGHVELAAAPARSPTPEDVSENIAEVLEAAARMVLITARAIGIFAVGMMGRALLAALIDLAGIVTPPLLRIAEDGEGRGNPLERVLGLLVAGVQIGVVLFRQLAISPPHVIVRRVTAHPENFIKILFHALS